MWINPNEEYIDTEITINEPQRRLINPVINLDNIVYFHKGKDPTLYFIQFVGGVGVNITWYFKDEEERDNQFNDLLLRI